MNLKNVSTAALIVTTALTACGFSLSQFGFGPRADEALEEDEEEIVRPQVVKFSEDPTWAEQVRTNSAPDTVVSYGEKCFEPFLRAALLKPYEKEIADGTEFGRTLEPLVADFVHTYYADTYGLDSVFWKLRAEALKAKEKFGDADPLLRLLCVDKRGDAAKKLFTEIDAQTKDDPDRLPLRFVAAAVCDQLNYGREKDVTNRSFELFAEWIERDRFDARLGFWLFAMRVDDIVNQTFVDFLAKHPAIDPWLSLIAKIDLENKAAWNDRGNGYANSVTEAGWDGWSGHSRKLKEHLAEARRLHPDWPEPGIYAANTFFPTSDDAETDEFYRWFTSGFLDMFIVQRCYLFYKCYPRWCGSRRDMEKFAEACYDTQRHDSLLPFWYAATHFALSFEYKIPQNEYFKNDEIARKCEEVLLKVIRNPKVENRKAWFLAQDLLSVLYYLRGEYEKIPEVFRRVEMNTCFGEPWNYIHNLAPVMQKVRTCAEKNHALLIPMHRFFEEGKYQEFLDAVAAAGTVAYTKNERDFIRDCTLIAKTKLGQACDWLEADLQTPYGDFINYGSAWQYDKGTYYRPSWGSRTGRLTWNPRFPCDSEFAFEISDLGDGKESTLIVHFTPAIYRGYLARYLAVYRKDGKLGVVLCKERTEAYDEEVKRGIKWIGEAKERTKIVLRLVKGELSVCFDDAPDSLQTNSSLSRHYDDFKECEFSIDMSGINVRLYNLRGRPLGK